MFEAPSVTHRRPQGKANELVLQDEASWFLSVGLVWMAPVSLWS